MEIRPAISGGKPCAAGTAGAGNTRARGAAAPAPGAPVDRRPEPRAADAGGSGGDRITISEEGRKLLEASESAASARAAGAVPTPGPGELSPDRLKTILDRIAGGWYEKGDVQREVLNLIAADLEAGTPQPPSA